MIDLNWQDDGFGNLVFTEQDAYEFNAAMLYPEFYYYVYSHCGNNISLAIYPMKYIN